MGLPPTAFIILGAVVAAFLTGLFNMTNLIISKEDKISDFRQKWLDSLREETSKLLAGIETLFRLVEPEVSGKSDGLTADELSKFRSAHHEKYRDLNEMRFRVLLRVNPGEPEHVNLRSRLDALTNAFYGPCTTANLADVRNLQGAIVQETQHIIKTTWENVKQGEKWFRRMRKVLLGVMVVLFVLILVAAFAAPKFLSQSTAVSSPSTQEQVVLRYFREVLDQGNLDVAEELFHPQCVIHRPEATLAGIDGIRRVAGQRKEAYSQFETQVHDIFESGDRVAVRLSHRAVGSGTWRSRLGSHDVGGKRVTWSAIVIFRLQNGKIIEEWVSRDELGMLLGFGLLKPGSEAR